MKAPPKRKGNEAGIDVNRSGKNSLNESPSEKEGKSNCSWKAKKQDVSLNESPSEKEGKFGDAHGIRRGGRPSMKAPPKRKGNPTNPDP